MQSIRGLFFLLCFISGIASSSDEAQPPSSDEAQPPKLSNCVTEKGRRCIFPFKYKGKTYVSCTDVEYTGGLWCATAVLEEGDLFTSIDSWDACKSSCNISSKPASESSSGGEESGEDVTTRLLIVLVVSFLVMLLGFSAAALEWISSSSSEVVSFLCGEVCLPVLVFEGVATAEASSVNWSFVKMILIGKFIVLGVTAIGAALSSKPGSRLISAGIYGLYVTMSADFGVGFPVFRAVFAQDKASLKGTLMYITLLSVLQDIIVNTVVIIMLELGKARQSSGVSFDRLARTVLSEIAKNNIVIAGCAGIFYKTFFSWTLAVSPDGVKLPPGVDDVVGMFASPYDFLALFQVGTSVASISLHSLRPNTNIAIAALSVLKVVISPLVIVGLVMLLPDGSAALDPQSQDRDQRAIIFAVLFGAIPTSPGVLSFAKSYNISTHILAPAVLFGLILSGPVMITQARIFQLLTNGVVIAALFPMTTAGLLGISLVICLFLFGGKRWLRLPGGVFFPYSLSMAAYSICMLAMRRTGECNVSDSVFMLADFLRAHLTWFGVVLLSSSTFGRLISSWGIFLVTVYGVPAALFLIGYFLDGLHFVRYRHTPFCIERHGFDVRGSYVVLNGLVWLAMVFAAVFRSKRFAKPVDDSPEANRHQRMVVIPSQAMGLYSLLASTIHLGIAATWKAAPFAAMPLLIMAQSVQGYGGLILVLLFAYCNDARMLYTRLSRDVAWLLAWSRKVAESSGEESDGDSLLPRRMLLREESGSDRSWSD